MLTIFNKLWLEYSSVWVWEYRLNKTDWRSYNKHKWIVTDFSWKWRPQGSQFSFVKWYLKLADSETYERFKTNFYLWEKKMEWLTKEKRDTLKKQWNDLPNLSKELIDYLTSRRIDYSKVKDCVKQYNNWIWLLMYDSEWPIWLKARTTSQDHKTRFVSLFWYKWDWIYLHWIDKSKDYIVVVEWLIDFLTLRQYDTNIVWLWSSKAWLEQIKQLAKKYKIYFIPDNDEAGKQTLVDIWTSFDYYLFDLEEYGVKDINELECKEQVGETLVNSILELWVDRSLGSLNNAIMELQRYQEMIAKQGKLWFGSPYPEIDKYTDWIIPGKVYTIAAYSNVGKSKFSYNYCNHFLKQGKRVFYISLEVDRWMLLLNLVCNMEQVEFWNVRNWYKPDFTKYKNLKIFDTLYDLEEIEQVVLSQCPDIVFIDFVQNIKTKSTSEYERMSKIARKIQEIAIRSKSAIITLSQLANDVAKEVWKGNTDFVSLKWWGELFASSDVIFVLRKNSDIKDEIIMKIVKNKYWIANKEFVFKVDFAKSVFRYSREFTF